jgi:transcriptional regulator with XRE-family HTH domain
LADQVRCTEGFLSKVENNKARLSLATLHRLVTALEINVASLFVEKSAPDDLVLLTRSGAFHDQDGHTSSRAGGNARAAGTNSVSRLQPANILHVAALAMA